MPAETKENYPAGGVPTVFAQMEGKIPLPPPAPSVGGPNVTVAKEPFIRHICCIRSLVHNKGACCHQGNCSRIGPVRYLGPSDGTSNALRGQRLRGPLPGPQGPDGDLGPTGAKGLRGPAGPRGPRGDVGGLGPTGQRGPRGTPGPPGERGPAGETGPVGRRGYLGPTGAPGPPGEKGPQGRVGPTGPHGAIGMAGPMGPRGPMGRAGETGPEGPEGMMGPIGPPGIQGPIGLRGPQGPIGPAGPIGSEGPTGERGFPGPRGPRGREGPVGPQGEVGPTGDPGERGLRGPRGRTGPMGLEGPMGETGPRGFRGREGPTGPYGPEGEPGPRGRPGRPGPTGPQGWLGATGPRGFRGREGTTGPEGPVGEPGPTGPRGAGIRLTNKETVSVGSQPPPTVRRGIVIGCQAGESQKDTDGNVLIGHQAGKELTDGNFNVFLGTESGRECREGNNSIAIGVRSLKESSAIGENIALGSDAMGEAGKTEFNIAVGPGALAQIRDNYNIAIGPEAGSELTGNLTNHNLALGRKALHRGEGTSVGNIAIGTSAGEELTGTNFQNVMIGEKAGQHLASEVLSIGNVILGLEAGSRAHDLSESVVIGAGAGENLTGNSAVIIGHQTAHKMAGSVNGDVLLGFQTGANRAYHSAESRNVMIGWKAGTGNATKDTQRSVMIGSESGLESDAHESILIGTNAGEGTHDPRIVAIGHHAGRFAQGEDNIFLGTFCGSRKQGSGNVLIGSVAGEFPGEEPLDHSVILGYRTLEAVKGSGAVVLGAEAGFPSVGFLSKDVIIGHQAGSGQLFADKPNLSKRWICIGSRAGQGNPAHPEAISPLGGDTVCLGHDAGRSDEQEFQRTVFVGNCAGSFAKQVHESVIVGNNAGLGMEGHNNLYLGANTGFGLKGSGNILIGHKVGENLPTERLEETFLLGSGTRSLLVGDLVKGNLALGVRSPLHTEGWGEGSCALYLEEAENESKGPRTRGGVLYNREGELKYVAPGRTPYIINSPPGKEHRYGRLAETLFALEVGGLSGGYLLSIKIASANPRLVYQAVFSILQNGPHLVVTSKEESLNQRGYLLDLSTPKQAILRSTRVRRSDLSSSPREVSVIEDDEEDQICVAVEVLPSARELEFSLRWNI